MIDRPDLFTLYERQIAHASPQRREELRAALARFQLSATADNYDALYNLLHERVAA